VKESRCEDVRRIARGPGTVGGRRPGAGPTGRTARWFRCPAGRPRRTASAGPGPPRFCPGYAETDRRAEEAGRGTPEGSACATGKDPHGGAEEDAANEAWAGT